MGENGLGEAWSYITLNVTLSCTPKALVNPWIHITDFLAFALLVHNFLKKREL